MYRAVTATAVDRHVAADDESALLALLAHLDLDLLDDGRVMVGALDVTRRIREPEVTRSVSAFAAARVVRDGMTDLQRKIGAGGRLVCEGRDMGTVVFPGAAVRFYLDASPRVRAVRRKLELEAAGKTVDLESLVKEIEKRDWADSTREIAPLKRVDGQIYVDSSDLPQEEVVAKLLEHVRRILNIG
jgi:cytidylate kinase